MTNEYHPNMAVTLFTVTEESPFEASATNDGFTGIVLNAMRRQNGDTCVISSPEAAINSLRETLAHSAANYDGVNCGRRREYDLKGLAVRYPAMPDMYTQIDTWLRGHMLVRTENKKAFGEACEDMMVEYYADELWDKLPAADMQKIEDAWNSGEDKFKKCKMPKKDDVYETYANKLFKRSAILYVQAGQALTTADPSARTVHAPSILLQDESAGAGNCVPLSRRGTSTAISRVWAIDVGAAILDKLNPRLPYKEALDIADLELSLVWHAILSLGHVGGNKSRGYYPQVPRSVAVWASHLRATAPFSSCFEGPDKAEELIANLKSGYYDDPGFPKLLPEDWHMFLGGAAFEDTTFDETERATEHTVEAAFVALHRSVMDWWHKKAEVEGKEAAHNSRREVLLKRSEILSAVYKNMREKKAAADKKAAAKKKADAEAKAEEKKAAKKAKAATKATAKA